MKKKQLFYLIILIPLVLIYILFLKKKSNKISKFIKTPISANSVVIFELNDYHLECLPGFTKYFTDLGFNADIIIRYNRSDSMERFEPKDKIQIFEYKDEKELIHYQKELKKKFRKYNYSLLQSIDQIKNKLKIYKKLGYYDNPKSLFVVHHTDFIKKMKIDKFISKKHAFGLADYGILTYLNPNYFGNFNHTHKKNNKISFYISSSVDKYYSYLILAVKNLKKKMIEFEINITGHSNDLSLDIIPPELRKYFFFHGRVSYRKLYQVIQKSDFIILNLYPDKIIDNIFRTFRATGSAQLAYGFYKPVIIEENFAPIYKFSNETAIIFKNHDLSYGLERATKISSKEYFQMSKKIKYLRETIYNISLNNLKNALNQ